QPRGGAGRRPAPQGTESIRVREPGLVADTLSEELVKLASRVKAAGEDLDDEQKIEFTSLADRATKLAASVPLWLGQQLPGPVYWIALTPGAPAKIDLCSAPIEVGPALKEMLYDKVPTVILTSATLSPGGAAGFRHFQDRLGLPDAGTLQLGSPF